MNEWMKGATPVYGSVHFKWTLASWPVTFFDSTGPSLPHSSCWPGSVWMDVWGVWAKPISLDDVCRSGKFRISTTLVIQVQGPNTHPVGWGRAPRDAPAPIELRRVGSRRGLARLEGVSKTHSRSLRAQPGPALLPAGNPWVLKAAGPGRGDSGAGFAVGGGGRGGRTHEVASLHTQESFSQTSGGGWGGGPGAADLGCREWRHGSPSFGAQR